MTALIKMPVILSTIKGTAMNKGKPRVWLEPLQSAVEEFGFVKGGRWNMEFDTQGIIITAAPDGKRVISGRVKNGITKCIFDIAMTEEQRQEMFQGSARLTCWISSNQILVTI